MDENPIAPNENSSAQYREKYSAFISACESIEKGEKLSHGDFNKKLLLTLWLHGDNNEFEGLCMDIVNTVKKLGDMSHDYISDADLKYLIGSMETVKKKNHLPGELMEKVKETEDYLNSCAGVRMRRNDFVEAQRVFGPKTLNGGHPAMKVRILGNKS